jgi:hypothetical protein
MLSDLEGKFSDMGNGSGGYWASVYDIKGTGVFKGK